MATSPRGDRPPLPAHGSYSMDKLDLSSVPPVRQGEEVVLTSTVPSTWPAAGDAAALDGSAPEGRAKRNEEDIATARPSHRRLAGIHTKSFDLEKGHRVEVFVRVRPMLAPELELYNQAVIVNATEASGVIRLHNRVGTRLAVEDHQFDGAFGPTSSQEEVYNRAVRPLVRDVCNGMNTAAFVYGATGTGKTHTMVGNMREPSGLGMIPRALRDVWDTMRAIQRPFRISVSMVEIYNEKLQDMFVPATAEEPLKIVADAFREGVFCQNLYEVEVKSPEQAVQLLEFAQQRSKQHETLCNKMSSRAHRVFMLVNEFTNATGGKEIGRLSMIDMAGSESMANASVAMLADARRLETKSINQSILTFGRVLIDLHKGSSHIPYRDSKLTRLVSEALGGFCRTVILATVSPARSCEDETLSCLSYGQMARRVYNKPQGSKLKRVMIELANTHEIYQRILEEDRAQIRELLKSVGPNKLNTVRMMRDILLAAHQRTEQSLAKEAKTMRRSLQACTRDLDALKTSTLARAGGLEEVQSAGNAGVASLRAQAAVARDVLYQCYQECVVTCTGVGDGVAAASARFAPLPAEFEQLGKSVAGLCEAVEGHVQWPDLSKYGGEAERFTGEVTRALFAHRSDVAHASTSATSALSSVLTAVRGYHEAVVAKVSQERARSQAAARECVEAATSVCAEVSAVFAEQTATIAELRAQLASVRAASSASTEARVAKLKEQFKGILRRQQAGEAERIATLEVSMKGRIEALQRQLEEVRQGSALAAKESEAALSFAEAEAAGKNGERLSALSEQQSRLTSAWAAGLSRVPDSLLTRSKQGLEDVRSFFAAHADSVVNQIALNNTAVMGVAADTLAGVDAVLRSAIHATAASASRDQLSVQARVSDVLDQLQSCVAEFGATRAGVTDVLQGVAASLPSLIPPQDAPAPAVCPVTVPDSDVTPVQYTRVLSAYDATWLPLWSQEVLQSKTLQALTETGECVDSGEAKGW